MKHSRQYLKLGAAAVAGTVLGAFAVTAAPPTQAYQDSQLCIINNTSKIVFADFDGSFGGRRPAIRMNEEACERGWRRGGYDVMASLRIGDDMRSRRSSSYLASFFVNNPAVGWPVIAARLQSNPSCSWDDYTNTCWYVRLGQRQHRCIQEKGYWLRPSREADSNGAKQFRVQVYDGTADPSTFGC